MKKFISLFSRENSIRGASLLLIITLAMSNVLGLIRDHFLTKNVSTFNLDIYYASFRIPDLIFNFLVLGAITSAFIPIFSDFLAQKKEEDGFETTNNLINIVLLFMVVSMVMMFFLMPYLMPFIVPKFDSERMNLAIKYSRLLMITPIFFSLSYILGGILNCYKRFFAYSLAPLVYNLSIIVGTAFIAPKYGLIGVIYFVIIGSFLHLLIQLPAAIKLGYRYRFLINFGDSKIARIIKLMVPRTISMGATQIMLIAYTALASALAAGSIAAFNLANNIQTMPVVVLGTSFATAVFPTLAVKISQNKKEQFSFYLNRALRAIGYLLIPATFAFILLRAQIVRLILGSGQFGWDDTKMTAMALGFFATSILAQGIAPILSRAFYALKDTKTPMYISIFTVIFSILVALPLSQTMSVAGLALAFSLGSYFNTVLLIFYLRKTYPGVLDRFLVYAYLKTFIISLIMGFFVWRTLYVMANLVDMTRFWGIFSQTLVALMVAFSIFFSLSYLLNQEEMKWAITRRINGEKT